MPEDHDPTKRASAIAYTREKDVLTTGVLYNVETPSMVDRLDSIKERAAAEGPTPSIQEILTTFFPSF